MGEIPQILLTVQRLTKRFGGVCALDSVSFEIPEGEIVGLIGPNGSGKTTLLECLAGVLPSDSMQASFRGEPLTQDSRSKAIFYLADAITPWPEQTVSWVLEYFCGLFKAERARMDSVARDLKIEVLQKTRMRALSKGQRKRVLLALALAVPHPLVIIDEPFEGLDLRQSREVQAVLRAYGEPHRSVLLSIHQVNEAPRICDRFLLLSNGRMVGQGTLEQLREGAHTRGSELEEIFLALT